MSPTNDIQIVPLGGPPATILLGDLPACNAVVHIVDRVLLPTLVSKIIVSNVETFMKIQGVAIKSKTIGVELNYLLRCPEMYSGLIILEVNIFITLKWV